MMRWISGGLLIMLATAGSVQAAEVEATVSWGRVITLATPLSGRLSSVRVDVGDQVKKGQLVASLDDRPLQASKRRAEAALKRLQGSYDEAIRELDRAKELFERTVLSPIELQQAQLAFSIAEADFDQAGAELEQAKLELEYSRIVAPVSGMIVERNAHPGEVVVNQLQVTAVLKMVDQTQLQARATVTLPVAQLPAPGSKVAVKYNGKSYDGRVTALQAAGDAGSSQLTVAFKTAQAVQQPGQATILLP